VFMHGVHRTEMIMLADLNADWQLKRAAPVAQVEMIESGKMLFAALPVARLREQIAEFDGLIA
jgi:hypothetical protein